MPLCQIPSRAAPISAIGLLPIRRRPFATSARRLLAEPHDDKESHYDVLQVPPNASPAEIKRSFYALSKKHHPDHNPSDPHAPRRFIRISEAYSVLSAPGKRAAYDRDARHSHSHVHRPATTHHYPSGPAGGRPASGLGRRRPPATNSTRGSFRGPPPSFYSQGGWGEHAEKRRAAHEQSAASGGSSSGGGASGSGSGSSSGLGGMGPGQDHFRRDVPHFDNVSHERTHKRQDQRREARRAAETPPTGGDGSPVVFVIGVGFIIVIASLAPLVFAAGPSEAPKRKPVKKKPPSSDTK